jgi:hypothetical protein
MLALAPATSAYLTEPPLLLALEIEDHVPP